MRRILAALALAALALPVAPARAATYPGGELCAYDFLLYPSGGSFEGRLNGGPVTVLDEDDPTVVHSGRLVCSIQVGWTNYAHSGPDAATVTGEPGTGALVASGDVAFTVDDWDTFWVCTRVELDSGTLYWNDDEDRNREGYWSSDPAARCQNTLETADYRPEDDGEVVAATDPVPYESAVCAAMDASPAIDEVLSLVWECDRSAPGSIVVARAPGTAVLVDMPFGWACTDVHTGLPVALGGSLAVPDPGVSCAPPGPARPCYRVNATGAMAPTGLGRVAVTSGCGTLAVTRTLSVVRGPAGTWTSRWWYPVASSPWRCTADESLVPPGQPAYVAECGAGFGTA